MMILVSYDVSTMEAGGARRLRRLARACLDYGQRVQLSVFEIDVDAAQWTVLKARLLDTIDPAQDSLRFYYLGQNWRNKVEHVGTKSVLDLDAPLVM